MHIGVTAYAAVNTAVNAAAHSPSTPFPFVQTLA